MGNKLSDANLSQFNAEEHQSELFHDGCNGLKIHRSGMTGAIRIGTSNSKIKTRLRAYVGTLSELMPSRPPDVASGHWMIIVWTSGYGGSAQICTRVDIKQGYIHPTRLGPSNTGEGGAKVDSDQQLTICSFFKSHLLHVRVRAVHVQASYD